MRRFEKCRRQCNQVQTGRKTHSIPSHISINNASKTVFEGSILLLDSIGCDGDHRLCWAPVDFFGFALITPGPVGESETSKTPEQRQ